MLALLYNHLVPLSDPVLADQLSTIIAGTCEAGAAEDIAEKHPVEKQLEKLVDEVPADCFAFNLTLIASVDSEGCGGPTIVQGINGVLVQDGWGLQAIPS